MAWSHQTSPVTGINVTVVNFCLWLFIVIWLARYNFFFKQGRRRILEDRSFRSLVNFLIKPILTEYLLHAMHSSRWFCGLFIILHVVLPLSLEPLGHALPFSAVAMNFCGLSRPIRLFFPWGSVFKAECQSLKVTV